MAVCDIPFFNMFSLLPDFYSLTDLIVCVYERSIYTLIFDPISKMVRNLMHKKIENLT